MGSSSQGSTTFDIDADEVVWLVHVTKKKEYSRDCLLKALAEAEAEAKTPKLVVFSVLTTVNTPIGSMQVTQANKTAVRDAVREVRVTLLQPLLPLVKQRKLESRVHVEQNNIESDGLVAAVHRFSADRLYVPVPKTLLGGALSLPMWASHLPPSVALVLVQGQAVLRQSSSFIPAAFRQTEGAGDGSGDASDITAEIIPDVRDSSDSIPLGASATAMAGSALKRQTSAASGAGSKGSKGAIPVAEPAPSTPSSVPASASSSSGILRRLFTGGRQRAKGGDSSDAIPVGSPALGPVSAAAILDPPAEDPPTPPAAIAVAAATAAAPAPPVAAPPRTSLPSGGFPADSSAAPALLQEAGAALLLTEAEATLAACGFADASTPLGKFGRVYPGSLPCSFLLSPKRLVAFPKLPLLWGKAVGPGDGNLLPVSVLRFELGVQTLDSKKEEVAALLRRQAGLEECPSLLPYVAWCPAPACLVSPPAAPPLASLQAALAQGLGEGGRTLRWRERVDVLVGVAQGLHALHSSPTPVVHSYLSPASIFLFPSDTFLHAKLAHIALPQIAACLSSSSSSSAIITGGEPGAAVYLDPDFLSGSPPVPAMDIFAFGAVAVDVLMNARGGMRKLAVDKLVSTVRASGTEDRDSIASELEEFADVAAAWPRRLVGEVAWVAAQCLAGSRAERPSSERLVALMQRLSDVADEVALEEDLGGFGTGEGGEVEE